MSDSKQVATELKELMTALTVELDDWTEKGNKSAAKRARKLTGLVAAKGKEFRAASVAETK